MSWPGGDLELDGHRRGRVHGHRIPGSEGLAGSPIGPAALSPAEQEEAAGEEHGGFLLSHHWQVKRKSSSRRQ